MSDQPVLDRAQRRSLLDEATKLDVLIEAARIAEQIIVELPPEAVWKLHDGLPQINVDDARDALRAALAPFEKGGAK